MCFIGNLSPNFKAHRQKCSHYRNCSSVYDIENFKNGSIFVPLVVVIAHVFFNKPILDHGFVTFKLYSSDNWTIQF
jgi:hypothetical protein